MVVAHDGNHAELARDNRVVRGGTDASGEDAVVRRGTAAALKVTEHGCSDFKAAALFDFRGDEGADAVRSVSNDADSFAGEFRRLGAA